MNSDPPAPAPEPDPLEGLPDPERDASTKHYTDEDDKD